MNLTKEKEMLLELAEKGGKNLFAADQKCQSTYYTAYTDSKHTGRVVEEFNSEDIEDFREMLTGLWADDAETKTWIPIILSAYIKCRDDKRGRFDNVETYNYMM